MVNTTDLDVRLANHAARVARANEHGWIRVAEESSERGIWAGISSVRQRVGLALVRAGERLRGKPTGRTVDPTAAV